MPEMIPPEIIDEFGYAKSLDVDKLASEIEKFGFQCNNCGACCTRQDEMSLDGWADNAVVVYPFEVRRIMEVTGLSWLEVVKPPASGEVDNKGRMHTFEWHLMQKDIGGHGMAKGKNVHACRFLNDKRCTIYECRPFLCRTYPFYMSDRKLCVGPCDGMGIAISKNECLKLANVIKERYVEDLNQMVLLLDMFEPYASKGNGGNHCMHYNDNYHDTDNNCGRESMRGSGESVKYIVHDSEGAHQINSQQE